MTCTGKSPTDMAEQFKHKSASVFQMRLVLDTPTDYSEAMTNEFHGSHRPAEVLNVEKTILLDQTALQSAKLIKGMRGDQQIETP